MMQHFLIFPPDVELCVLFCIWPGWSHLLHQCGLSRSGYWTQVSAGQWQVGVPFWKSGHVSVHHIIVVLNLLFIVVLFSVTIEHLLVLTELWQIYCSLEQTKKLSYLLLQFLLILSGILLCICSAVISVIFSSAIRDFPIFLREADQFYLAIKNRNVISLNSTRWQTEPALSVCIICSFSRKICFNKSGKSDYTTTPLHSAIVFLKCSFQM